MVWTNIPGVWTSNIQSDNYKMYAKSKDTELKDMIQKLTAMTGNHKKGIQMK